MNRFVLILILFSSYLLSAKVNITKFTDNDSLLMNLNYSENDSNKVLILNYLGNNLNLKDSSLKQEYYNDAYKISSKLKWKYGIAFSLLNLSELFTNNLNNITLNDSVKFLENIKIAEQISIKNNYRNIYKNILKTKGLFYKNHSSDSSISLKYFRKSLKINIDSNDLKSYIDNTDFNSEIYDYIASIYLKYKDYDKADSNINYALYYCQNNQNPNKIIRQRILKRESNLIYTLANIYQFKTDYQKSFEYLDLCKSKMESLNDNAGVGTCLNNIGHLYRNLGTYSKAIENYQLALYYFDENELPEKVKTYLNIGSIYQLQREYSTANENYLLALGLIENTKFYDLKANVYNFVAGLYLLQDDINKSLEYINKSLKINMKIKNKIGLADNYYSLSKIEIKNGKIVNALDNLNKSKSIYEELDNKINLASVYSSIGNLYFKIIGKNLSNHRISKIIKKYKIDNINALNFILKSNSIYKEIGELPAQAQISKDISDIYYEMNDFENSIEFLRNYVSLKDSILKTNIQKRIAVILSIRENEIRNKEMQLLQSEGQTQKLRSYLLFGGIIIFISAFIIAIYRFNEKRKLSNKLTTQNLEIEKQKIILENKNTQIYDSIKYASTIQSAILPWDNTLKSAFEDYFVIYKPKDIVSGDFYWHQEVDGIKFIAVIDCTGHGIPGSMLTVIASSVLDDAVLSHKIIDTGEILTHINIKVTEVLNQRLSANSIRDGMEIALVAIHPNYIQFSTAGRPIYCFSKSFENIKTDKRGIAGKSDNENYQFSSVKIEKINGTVFYLTTDGFADQMDEQSKKYSNKRFINVLKSIYDKPFTVQKQVLENELISHKGNRDQIDDITILGVKI